jgi:hypothetical protein
MIGHGLLTAAADRAAAARETSQRAGSCRSRHQQGESPLSCQILLKLMLSADRPRCRRRLNSRPPERRPVLLGRSASREGSTLTPLPRSQGDRAPASARFRRRVRPRARGCSDQGAASASRPRRAIDRPTKRSHHSASRRAHGLLDRLSPDRRRLPYHGSPASTPSRAGSRKSCRDAETVRRQ